MQVRNNKQPSAANLDAADLQVNVVSPNAIEKQRAIWREAQAKRRLRNKARGAD